MKKEPKVRRDGRCVVCKKPRNAITKAYDDPFCSTACCHQYHEVKHRPITFVWAEPEETELQRLRRLVAEKRRERILAVASQIPRD